MRQREHDIIAAATVALNTRLSTQKTVRTTYDKISNLETGERERQGTASDAKVKSGGTDDTVCEDREEADTA
jgi:hypothetical protein